MQGHEKRQQQAYDPVRCRPERSRVFAGKIVKAVTADDQGKKKNNHSPAGKAVAVGFQRTPYMTVHQTAEKKQYDHGASAMEFHRQGFPRMHAFPKLTDRAQEVMRRQPGQPRHHEPGTDAIYYKTMPALQSEIDLSLQAGVMRMIVPVRHGQIISAVAPYSVNSGSAGLLMTAMYLVSASATMQVGASTEMLLS